MKPMHCAEPTSRMESTNCAGPMHCAEPTSRMESTNCAGPTRCAEPASRAEPTRCMDPMSCAESTRCMDPASCAEPTNWVYMVECRDGTLYTGWTTDVAKRVAAHSAGRGAKYTRSRAPVHLVYAEQCADKSAALRREAALKKLTRAQKLALAEGWRAKGEV